MSSNLLGLTVFCVVTVPGVGATLASKPAVQETEPLNIPEFQTPTVSLTQVAPAVITPSKSVASAKRPTSTHSLSQPRKLFVSPGKPALLDKMFEQGRPARRRRQPGYFNDYILLN